MNKAELQKIFDDLTLKEKIYQLVQLSGEFFKSDALAVGPKQKLGIDQEVVDMWDQYLMYLEQSN